MVQAPQPSSSREKVDGPEQPAQQVFRGTGGSAERRQRGAICREDEGTGRKRNETMLFAATWADPETITGSEGRQTEGRTIAACRLHAEQKTTQRNSFSKQK